MSEIKLSALTEITEVQEDDYYVITDASDGNATRKVKAINSEEKAGVFGFISTSAETDIAVADTWYKLAGTFTNNILEKFTVSATGIKYIGTNDFACEVNWSGSFTSNTNNPIVTIGISINGVIQDCSRQPGKIGAVGDPTPITGLCVFTLSENDEILINAKADKIIGLTAESFQTSLQKFY